MQIGIEAGINNALLVHRQSYGIKFYWGHQLQLRANEQANSIDGLRGRPRGAPPRGVDNVLLARKSTRHAR
jgi:hypothetical protein